MAVSPSIARRAMDIWRSCVRPTGYLSSCCRREGRKLPRNPGLRWRIPASGESGSRFACAPKITYKTPGLGPEIRMWDFSVGKALSAVIRTTPFIILRLAVYLGIGFAYLFAVGIGALVGTGIGYVGSHAAAGAFWGGLVGFGLTSAVLYLAREYILYLVKAAHIAVLVEIYDGRPIPAGQKQISYGAEFVKTHFAESSVLFGVDQIIKAVLRVITGTLNAITAFLPIPALQTAMRLFNAVLRVSLTYVDELILAYLIRTRTTNPWQSSQDALILYAQNYKHFLKNAVWLAIFMWGITLVIFLILVGPAAAVVAVLPSHSGIWVV